MISIRNVSLSLTCLAKRVRESLSLGKTAAKIPKGSMSTYLQRVFSLNKHMCDIKFMNLKYASINNALRK